MSALTERLHRQPAPAVAIDRRRADRRRRLFTGLRVTGVQLFCFVVSAGFFALPLVYLVLQAFKQNLDFLQDPTGLPRHWTWSNFSAAWTQGDFSTEMLNSLIYALVPDVITLVLGVFLAFPISRGWFRRSNVLYAFFVFSGFLPAGLIPLFIEAQKLGLYDNRVGYLTLTSLTGAGFFFFVGYIKTIPRELDEAAAMDGCGYVRFILTIVIPQMKPALATFAVFGFVASWNNLILPLIMLTDSSLWPVTRGLYSFFGEHASQWPLIAAATMIVAAPVLLVFALLQRFLVEGVAGGAAAGAGGVGAAPAPGAAVAAEK
ncbi:carbohydrate ABC transporter permease [Streptacidiphilus fuscans]|uniref:carbohydrate ABC transporter permease n=1 Tax=Streptacidiphilus fuscans TaxID=2789292 RepID=UPI001C071A50|nr:carbohydrate ABC transporter permease [Streptacidiphilus fuscans]